MKTPLVTVIITSYNKEDYIQESIRSVINQSYKNIELIIVDDESNDNTVSKIKELGLTNVRFIEKANGGAASARNAGIKYASGKYIALLDGDDLWHVDKIKLQVDALEKHSDVPLVSCISSIIDKNGKCTGLQAGKVLNGIAIKNILEQNGIATWSVPLMRKSAMDEVGMLNEDLIYADDIEYWIRLLENNKIITLNKPLVGFRRNINNLTRNYKEFASDIEKAIVVALKGRRSEQFIKKYSNRHKYTTAAICFFDENYNESRHYLFKCLKKDPLYIFNTRVFALFSLLLIKSFIPNNIFKFFVFKLISSKIFCVSFGRKYLSAN